jgi:hypothetical protein
MDPSIKFFFVVLLILMGLSLFVPIVTNPNPVDCNNYPDGTGGYYLKCNDEHITLFKKLTLPKGTVETRAKTF